MMNCVHRSASHRGCDGMLYFDCKADGNTYASECKTCDRTCANFVPDLDAMLDGQLLEELVDRVMDWQAKLAGIHAWDMARTYTGSAEEKLAEMEEDEAFCRVREIVRKVKNDETIWEC